MYTVYLGHFIYIAFIKACSTLLSLKAICSTIVFSTQTRLLLTHRADLNFSNCNLMLSCINQQGHKLQGHKLQDCLSTSEMANNMQFSE